MADSHGHTRSGGVLWQPHKAEARGSLMADNHGYTRPGWGASRQKTMTRSSREELLKDHHKKLSSFLE